MAAVGLFEVEAKARRRLAGNLPLHVPPGRCHLCVGPMVSVAWGQLALLRHGGHGATEMHSREVCPRCGWAGRSSVTEVRPPRRETAS